MPRAALHDIANFLTVSNGHREQAQKDLESAANRLASAEAHLRKAMEADLHSMRLARRALSSPSAETSGQLDLNGVVCQLSSFAELSESTELRLECHEGPLPLMGDGLSLLRAFMNLCLNARNAGARRIRIRTLAALNSSPIKAVAIVEDDGCGMSRELLDRLWELPESSDGHGHGLRIVKRTIDQMNGTVSVHSVPGKGTTFTIALPLSNGECGMGNAE